MTIKFAGLALFCAAVLFSLSFPAFADNELGGGLGVNFSSLTNFPGYSGNSEFQIGAFADWGLMDIWYLETGFRYDSYGVSESTTSGSTTTNISLDVHYLEIPVLIKPKIEVNGWYPYALAGPVFGFNVGNSASSTVNGTSASVSLNTYNTMNVALDFGVGCEVPVMTGVRGFLQFDYALGLTNILSTSSSTTSVTSETRGANFTLGAAVPF